MNPYIDLYNKVKTAIGGNKVTLKSKENKNVVNLPIGGGRQSVNNSGTLLSVLLDSLEIENPQYPYELLDALTNLAIYKDDLSYAVDNLAQLGNTKYEVTFDKDLSDKKIKEASEELAIMGKKWYKGGIHSLVSDLIANIAITGAISREIVPELDLLGVKNIVDVEVKDIRIFYDVNLEDYKYFQNITRVTKQIQDTNGLIELNPITYKHYAIRTFGSNPYPIPPFLSALDGIKLDNDVICNLKTIVSRLGVFGFLSVLLDQPEKKPNETDQAYYNRLNNHIQNQVKPMVDKGFNNGYVIGFKSGHEFDMKSTTPTNVEGLARVLEVVQTKFHSGLKQDPMMLGRNQTTTETLGRVLLAKLSNQVRDYQKLVACFLEDVFLLHLQLRGFKIKTVKVEFVPPMLGDESKEQEAYSKKIDNYIKLYDQGILSQNQVAKGLGYDEADLEEPRKNNSNTIDTEEEDDVIDGNTTETNNMTLEQARLALGADLQVFEYNACSSCGTNAEGFASFRGELEKQFKQYFDNVRVGYSNGIIKMSAIIGKRLANLSQNSDADQVAQIVILELFKNWKIHFTDKQQGNIKSWITSIYSIWRKDKSILGKRKNIPKAVFDTEDFRVLDYYRKSDSVYLGKFITDPDTIKKITKFIKEEHIKKGLPIGSGSNKEALKKFRNKFSKVLLGEEWKIERILRTTVNRLRNTGAIMYMNQAEVQKFERIEVNDRNTCAYCKELHGLEFSVPFAVDKIQAINKIEPGYIGLVDPFITSLAKPEELKGKKGTELQDLGLFSGIIPHPNCRGKNVAVI